MITESEARSKMSDPEFRAKIRGHIRARSINYIFDFRCIIVKEGDMTLYFNAPSVVVDMLKKAAAHMKQERQKVEAEYNTALQPALVAKQKSELTKLYMTLAHNTRALEYSLANQSAESALKACYTGQLAEVKQAFNQDSETWALFCDAGGLLVAVDNEQGDIFEFVIAHSDNYKTADDSLVPAIDAVFSLKNKSGVVKK